MKKLGCAFFVFVFLLACASSGFAQSQTTTGTVQGDVVDERGGSVAGATIEAKNLDTNFTQTEKTNSAILLAQMQKRSTQCACSLGKKRSARRWLSSFLAMHQKRLSFRVIL